MKIIEYKTATGEDCASLDAAVNKLLAQGFQLYGSPYSRNSKGGSGEVAQAVVRNGMREAHEPQEVFPQTALAP